MTTKQEKVLAQLKKTLEDEHYKIAIQAQKGDKNIDWSVEGIEEIVTDEEDYLKWICAKNNTDVNVDDLYKIIKVDVEQIR